MTNLALSTPDFLAVIEAAQTVDTTSKLVATMEPAFTALGVKNFVYGKATGPKGARTPAVQLGISDTRWARHYAEHGLVSKDGMFPRALQSTDPFTWCDLVECRALDDDGVDVLEQARSFALRDGFVVPIHHLNGTSAAVVLTSDTVLEWSPRERAAAHLLSIYFAALGSNLSRAKVDEKEPTLSRRQRECLQWVRAGKTDWEIARILGLSQHTVNEYIEAACKRLGVRTRAQAVIEAITRGLISV